MSASALLFLQGISGEHNVHWLPCLGKDPQEALRSGVRTEVCFPRVEASGGLCARLSTSFLHPVKAGLGNDLASIPRKPTGSKGGGCLPHGSLGPSSLEPQA